jgi:hypothetical protein
MSGGVEHRHGADQQGGSGRHVAQTELAGLEWDRGL